jgi:hypothetical protein
MDLKWTEKSWLYVDSSRLWQTTKKEKQNIFNDLHTSTEDAETEFGLDAAIPSFQTARTRPYQFPSPTWREEEPFPTERGDAHFFHPSSGNNAQGQGSMRRVRAEG